jgi:hypothetical protein
MSKHGCGPSGNPGKDRQRRDPDLERDILLAIEAYDGESRPGYIDISGLETPDLQVK